MNYPDNFDAHAFDIAFGFDENIDTSISDGLSNMLNAIVVSSKDGGLSDAQYIAICANLRAFTIEMDLDENLLDEIEDAIGEDEWYKLATLHDAIVELEHGDGSDFSTSLRAYHNHMETVKASQRVLGGVE